MFKPKGPLDSSTYTKYLRQRANTNMYQADIGSGVPQVERMSIISRPPIRDVLTTGLLRQLNAPLIIGSYTINVGVVDLADDQPIFNNLQIVRPSNIVNFSFIGGSGYESVVAFVIQGATVNSATIDGIVTSVSEYNGGYAISFSAGTLKQSSVLRIAFSTTVYTLTSFCIGC